MVEYNDSDKEGVVWNFDEAMGKLIFNMKVNFLESHRSGDLEKAYWDLFYLLSEIEPSLDEIIRDEINNNFDAISSIKKENENINEMDDEDKANYFSLMVTLYRKLCNELVENDFYFRKKKGYTGL